MREGVKATREVVLTAEAFAPEENPCRLLGKPMPPHSVMAANRAEQRLAGMPWQQAADQPAIALLTGAAVHENRRFVARPHECEVFVYDSNYLFTTLIAKNKLFPAIKVENRHVGLAPVGGVAIGPHGRPKSKTSSARAAPALLHESFCWSVTALEFRRLK